MPALSQQPAPQTSQTVPQAVPAPVQAGPSNSQKAADLANHPVLSSTLKKGSKGPEVETLQKFLGISADGNFGSGTEKALKAWQSSHGLDADGIAGPGTRAVIAGQPPPKKRGGDADPESLTSRYESPDKFIPKYKATAFSESDEYRKKDDPYAVGAITQPSKKEDLGGKTYGTYQFESYVYKDGTNAGETSVSGSTLLKFVNFPGNPFGKELQEIVKKHGVASAEFDAKWKELTATENQKFGKAQEEFLEADVKEKVTRLFDLANVSAEARKDARLFDLAIGTINQYDTLADAFARQVAEQQKEAKRSFTAEEVGKALQNAKMGSVESNFRSSPKAWDGIRNRINREKGMFNTPAAPAAS